MVDARQWPMGYAPWLQDEVVGLLPEDCRGRGGALNLSSDACRLHLCRDLRRVAHERILTAAGPQDGARDWPAVDAGTDGDARGLVAVLVHDSLSGRRHDGEGEVGEAGGVIGGLVIGEVGGGDISVADYVDLLHSVNVCQAVELAEQAVEQVQDLVGVEGAADGCESDNVCEQDRGHVSGHGFDRRAFEHREGYWPWDGLHECKAGILSAISLQQEIRVDATCSVCTHFLKRFMNRIVRA